MPTTAVRFQESLTESVYSPDARVDRANKVIHHVKILGKDSRNQREYTAGARTEAATRYDGMTVNLNHPDKEAVKRSRGIEEKWGWLESITDEADGVYGDLHYLETHQYTPQLLELAERNPRQFGLSHNADVVGYREGRKEVIESVEKVRSVDVVQRPATTSSLFEEEEEPPMSIAPKKRTMRTLLESLQAGSKKRKHLQAVLEMDGMADMGITPDMSVEGGDATEGSAASDPMKDAIKTMILAILDQDLPSAEAIAQITHVLEGPSAPGSEAAATPATEGVDEMRKELKAMKAETAARDILEEADIKATGGRLKSVIAVMEDEDELGEVLSSFPKRSATAPEATPTRVPKPKFSRPAMEETDPNAEPKSALAFTDAKSFASSVR